MAAARGITCDVYRGIGFACVAVALACALAAPTGAEAQCGNEGPGSRTIPDTGGGALIPAGYGTLHEEDVAIKLALPGVLVQLIPLDESVTRVLAPDSYRSLHDLLQSKQGPLAHCAALHDLRERNVWIVQFFGLAPDASFTPLDLTISAPGRDFRPLELIPLTPGFGQNRLQVGRTQRALYLFDDGLPLNQPLTATMGSVSNSTDWPTNLRRIESERASVEARAAKKAGHGTPAYFLIGFPGGAGLRRAATSSINGPALFDINTSPASAAFPPPGMRIITAATCRESAAFSARVGPSM